MSRGGNRTSTLRRWANAYRRFVTRFTPAIHVGSTILGVANFVASVCFLIALALSLGFDHRQEDLTLLGRIVRACQITFLTSIIYNWTLNMRQTLRDNRPVRWVAEGATLLTLLPLIYPHPTNPWIPWLEQLLYSRGFLLGVLGAFSAVDLSFGIIKMLGRRTNPSLILSASFLMLILIGTLVLMMPKCTVEGISFTDSLFVATSAVSITGLTPVDVSATFTQGGLLVLALLIQTGGLGVMTFTSFFAIFFSGNTSVYSQLMVKDMVYSQTISALIPTLLYILGFTLAIEALGAGAIWLSIHGTLGMTLREEAIFSAFHSLSAFCNAGFSNIEGGLSNPQMLLHNRSIYLIISALVLAGGIGFPILVNFKQAIGQKISKLWHRLTGDRQGRGASHLYDLNTKLVLSFTLAIFALTALAFFILEYNHSLRGLPLADKVVQSVFNSFVPRSSGFASLNPAGFLNVTLLMFIVLMWIGGASQSTAGGIKVNTFAAMLLNLRSIIRGHKGVNAFGRSIAITSLRRANAVIALSILSYIAFSAILLLMEPALPTRDLLYESASALFTVGSSLGVTDRLGDPAKVLLSVAMFTGRVGILSLLCGFFQQNYNPPVSYPSGDIIIN